MKKFHSVATFAKQVNKILIALSFIFQEIPLSKLNLLYSYYYSWLSRSTASLFFHDNLICENFENKCEINPIHTQIILCTVSPITF